MGATQRHKLSLVGLMPTAIYRKAYEAGMYLQEARGDEYEFEEQAMVPVDFSKWKAQHEKDGAIKSTIEANNCVVTNHSTGQLQSADQFISWVKAKCGFRLFDIPDDHPDSYLSKAISTYRGYLSEQNCTYVWLDLTIDYSPDSRTTKRVTFELYSKICPKTCENFRHLCLGDLPNVKKGDGKTVRTHYKGTAIFRIVKNGWIQGGDVSNPGTMKAGNGGTSIYGDVFPDESFDVRHSDEGVLGMANNGPNTNNSQFYITTSRSEWMDKRYVAFGRVIEGLDAIREIHQLPTKPNQSPTVPVMISDCGVLDLHANKS
eukprot:TRINITY_DN17738_c0_g1_i1.p1 TRINITY_DN17738_c0_g1~~TRINITY_DN17738_c0_g1_i1.p1  ORF type:complete len:317 (+),score=39.56 TRINITY_DN17738_c0_g1_i1:92-1042(+)